MNLKEILKEQTASKKNKEKLLEFLRKAARGFVNNQMMIAAGFNLKNPGSNNEGRISQALGTVLDINITEDDIEEALKELGIDSLEDVASGWVEAKSGVKQ